MTHEVRPRASGQGRVLSRTSDDGPDLRATPRRLEVRAAHAVPAVVLRVDHVLPASA